jgi:hypothetical protein
MTLPYPLLARGKINTDMLFSENLGGLSQGPSDIANTAPQEFQIERLQKMLRAYEEAERSNAVAVRSQVVLTLFPLLKDGVSIEDGISRAALISDFILNGQRPVLTPRAPGK